MANVLKFLSLFCSISVLVSAGDDSLYSIGDVRNCLHSCTGNGCTSRRMEALPGIGFDNLRNVDLSEVVQYNYSLCKTTNDGRFLIPDDVTTISVQSSRLDSYATLFDHYNDYVSSTSASINLGGSVYSVVNGKFGFEYQRVKQQQIRNSAKTTRTQMKSTLYKVILEPDPQLHPKFKNRLLDIAANIQNNNTVYAAYLCELLVRDYGTHVLRSVETGAVVNQVDSISSKYVSDKQGSSFNITASAAASFKGKFGIEASFGFQRGKNELNEYMESTYSSELISIGGPLVHPNMTLDEWEAGVLDSAVAVDRSGDPIHYIITPATLPELPAPTLRELVEFVYAGIEMYYSVNTHLGCTDPSSPNFDYEANLDDNSCSSPNSNYSFGGVFQTCETVKGQNSEDLCEKQYATKNPLTGNFSCPEGYTELKLHSGTGTHVKKEKQCDNVCHHSGFLGLGRTCKCLTAWVSVLSSAKYNTYWCVAVKKAPEGSGALFGGLYTSKTMNPITNSKTCPFHFYPLSIGKDLKVCISTQLENAYKYSVPFGGFLSCKIGNPLASESSSRYLKQCPRTYKKFLATVDEGCELNYCAQMQTDTAIRPPRLPPFHDKPGLKMNLSQSMVIQGPYGDVWIRDALGKWVTVNDNDMTGEEVLEYLVSSSRGISPSPSGSSDGNTDAANSLSGLGTAMIVVCAVLSVTLIVVIVIFGVYVLRVTRKGKRSVSSVTISRAYASIDGGNDGDLLDKNA